MSEPPTTRTNADGFKGEYPKSNEDWAEKAYRDAGMEPPWLLEYEDGKVVGPASRETLRHATRLERRNRPGLHTRGRVETGAVSGRP